MTQHRAAACFTMLVAPATPVYAAPFKCPHASGIAILPLQNWWIQIATVNTSTPPTDNLMFRKAVQAALDMDGCGAGRKLPPERRRPVSEPAELQRRRQRHLRRPRSGLVTRYQQSGYKGETALGPNDTMLNLVAATATYKPKNGVQDPKMMALCYGMNTLPTVEERKQAFAAICARSGLCAAVWIIHQGPGCAQQCEGLRAIPHTAHVQLVVQPVTQLAT